MDQPNDKLKCKVYGQEFTKIDCVTRHAKRVHKLDPKAYYDRYFKQPDEGKCKCCGIDTKYWDLQHGYREFCSRKCFWQVTAKLESTKENRKKTCLEKFGTEQYMQSADFKKKSVATSIEKYNVANPGGSAESIRKIKQTKLERHGDENWNNTKKKETETIEKFRPLCPGVTFLSYTNKQFSCRCNKCGKEFTICYQTLCNRLYDYKTPICLHCHPLVQYDSAREQEFTDYIKMIYSGEIIENDRSVLKGKVLDIYMPGLNLAFEFDGLYWHSELHKTNNYHVDKTDECIKAGIRLIHVFEDEWQYKRDIVKSRIKGLLGQNNRIFARKCEIREVPYNVSRTFLDNCHIQGNCMSTYRYGLFYNDELVSLMTFGKSRFADEYELLRFCNKLNINVIGGASRLFNHFMKEHPEINNVVSYADRRWSAGNLYGKLGFECIEVTPPSYFYIIDGIRHNRIEFQKHKLVKEGFDKNKSEHEIMLERKIYRIYDCGNLKYRYTKSPEKPL